MPGFENVLTVVLGLLGLAITKVPGAGAASVHVPVPEAAMVAVPVMLQATFWSAPALGFAVTTSVTVLLVSEQMIPEVVVYILLKV